MKKRNKSSVDYVTLYRVEQPHNGSGPYRYIGDSPNYMHPFESVRHPLPAEDPSLYSKWNPIRDALDLPSWGFGSIPAQFAFPSLKALRQWFRIADRKALARLGFTVSVYRIDPSCAAVGKRQAVFLPEAARRVGSVGVVNLGEA